jgi:hypothetical protein
MLRSSLGDDNPDPSCFGKDDMKITKRLSIEFQHREVTISVAGSTLHVQDGEPNAANTDGLSHLR